MFALPRAALIGLAYLVTGWLGLQIPYAGTHITLVWLPTGIAVAGLFRWGTQMWPGVFLGSLATNLAVGSSPTLAIGIAVGNTLAPLLCSWWLQRADFSPTFERQRDVLTLVVVAGAGMLVSASSGCLNLAIAGLLPTSNAGQAWLSWWLGDTVGVLLAAPLLLAIGPGSLDALRRHPYELLLWLALGGTVSWAVFVHGFGIGIGFLPLAFLPLPLLVWGALRYGHAVASLAVLLLSITAAWSTALGNDSFVVADAHTNLILLWSYIASLVLIELLVVGLQAERLTLEQQLRESELRLRTIVDTDPECVKVVDANGKLLQINRAGLAMIEADSTAQVLGRNIDTLILPPYRSDYLALTHSAFQGASGNQEFEIRGIKGTVRWLHSQVVPLRNTEGNITAALCVSRDITLTKTANDALRQSQQRFATAFHSCPVAASIATADEGRFLDVNENYLRDFGWSSADLVGRTSVEAGLWPDQQTRDPWAQAIRSAGRLVNYETVWMHKNGERRQVSLSAEITTLGDKRCILAYATDITERKQAEQGLAANEARLRTVLDGVQNGVVVISQEGTIESFNQSAEHMFGYRAAEVVGRNVNLLMPEPHHSAHDGYLRNFRQTGKRNVIGKRSDVTAQRKDGSLFPIELGVTETDFGGQRYFVGSISDLSFRKAAEAELRIAATAFESSEGMMVTDPHGVILRVNQAFTETTGYSAQEAIGQTPRLLRTDRHDEAFYRTMWETIRAEGKWQGEIWDRRKDGSEYPKWLTISAVFGEDGQVSHYVGAHQDITERKMSEERIKELAFYDPLTRLPNRTLLLDRLKHAMSASARNDCYGALLFIDLDNFKILNDTLGHDIGDLLLQQVAHRIASSLRAGDTVARLGGDEFVVVLESLSATPEEAATQTKGIGEKILTALHSAYTLDATEYRSSASLGATLFKGPTPRSDELMKQADLAMYKSKQSGRNALHFFDPVMQTLLIERADMEGALRKALDCEQLVVHYQAQVADTGRVTGVEALVRWQHPSKGMIPPAKFITLAEETGLILPLGNWVLHAACSQLARWASDPATQHLTIAVNVSAKEFREPGYVHKVLAALDESGANPKLLKLELTESLLVDNLNETVEKMFALRAKGVGFALDDFGTGYSSLSYLKRLPLDQLKIDQSFVRDILVDPNDAAIAKTIVALAQSLGLGVIAEGVELQAQCDYLRSSGCHAYQGYLFCKPMPASEFETYLRGL